MSINAQLPSKAHARLPHEVKIRAVAADDSASISKIYGHYVQHSTATFEEVPPDARAMADRIYAIVSEGYPWIVATSGQQMLGYAYLGPHKSRAAYRLTAEDSIYIDPSCVGQKIGSLLLSALLEKASSSGRIHTIMAVIGDSDNAASIRLHEKHGFEIVGTAGGLGCKFGRLIDVVYMQHLISPSPMLQKAGEAPHSIFDNVSLGEKVTDDSF